MTFDYKNASKDELKAHFKTIAKKVGDDTFFTKKELYHLPEILSVGEEVIAFSSGLMDANTWVIVLTNKRIIFLDKGMLYGLKQTAIDLDKVNAISGDTGLVFGKISIQDGAAHRTIKQVLKHTVVPFTNLARDAIEARKHAQSGNHVAAAPDSIAQLERLATLLEKGVLTAEEFARQKDKILA